MAGRRTSVYVDGFNLYYRALKKTPYRWLNLVAAVEKSLGRKNQVATVNYYTARVSGNVKSTSPARQQMYINALRTLPEIAVHYGSFLANSKTLPRYPIKSPPTFVEVLVSEEKGSDVNLASHLVYDGCRDKYEVAIVVSNDTDLIEPVRIVAKELRKPVGILSPVQSPASGLKNAATFVRRMKKSTLKACQFPEKIREGIEKPEKWRLQDPVFLALEQALSGHHSDAVESIMSIGENGLRTLFGKPYPPRVGTAYTALKALAASGSMKPQDRRTVVESVQDLAKAAAWR